MWRGAHGPCVRVPILSIPGEWRLPVLSIPHPGGDEGFARKGVPSVCGGLVLYCNSVEQRRAAVVVKALATGMQRCRFAQQCSDWKELQRCFVANQAPARPDGLRRN